MPSFTFDHNMIEKIISLIDWKYVLRKIIDTDSDRLIYKITDKYQRFTLSQLT